MARTRRAVLGSPQRRKRIALVADFGGLSAPEILFERKGLSWDFESGKETGKETARANESGAGSAEPILTENNQNYATVRPNVISSDSNGTPHAVCYDARGNGGSEITPTMTGDHQRRITDYTALCIGNGQLNQISMAEQANTLDTMHDQQAVMVAARLDSTVRRFTPLECERLQGYPDGWTDIGEWTDSKGKKHKDADSPRYKALGNSIALPPWKWVLKRLCACYERDATMASLFDGIGGFPLIWEQLNGKGSCLWASEIEEFPMAVTKLRFGE